MSRIKEAFQNGKAFIPFITCGDPDLETTKEIVKVMVDNGADLDGTWNSIFGSDGRRTGDPGSKLYVP